jgi:hypothetical protein
MCLSFILKPIISNLPQNQGFDMVNSLANRIVGPLSEKLPPVADGNKGRDPHSDNVLRLRDLGTLSPRDECLHPPPSPVSQGSRNFVENEMERVEDP